MSALASAAGAIVTELESHGVSHALVGGLAVSVQTEPRFTQDLDFAVAAGDDEAAERIVRELVAAGYQPVTIVEHESKGRLATVRLATPNDDGIVDLLFASSGIEPEIAAAAEVLQVLPSLRVPVARVGHLVALKLLARDDASRPQDWLDLLALRAVADADELARAAEAVRLIQERSFSRGRDLVAELELLQKN